MDRDPLAPKNCEIVSAGAPPPRLTAGQQAVLKALQQQPQPISPQALHGVMGAQRPIGLATVYRSLDALKLLGLVQHRARIYYHTLEFFGVCDRCEE